MNQNQIVFDCIKNMNIALTNRCNLNCSYCFANSNTNNQELTVNQIKEAIQIISPSHRINFSGGEPMLRKNDIYELIPFCAEQMNLDEIHISTNGTIPFDFDYWDKYEFKNKFWFNFSMDGFKTLNDARRGVGVFDNTFDFLSEALNRGYICSIKATLPNEILLNDLEYLRKFAYFLDKKNFIFIRIGNEKNIGRAKKLLNEKEIKEIYQMQQNVLNLNKECNVKQIFQPAFCIECGHDNITNAVGLKTNGDIKILCDFLDYPICNYKNFTIDKYNQAMNYLKENDIGCRNCNFSEKKGLYFNE